MTSGKHLKARIRARMARTGERYSTARRHVAGAAEPAPTDHGWTLRGGTHPDSANIANVLAHTGVPGLSEAMVLGVGGGLGAGYILWEFKEHGYTHLTLGYRYRWNYIDWTARTLDRLGATARVHATSGAKGAATELTASLAAGRPAIVWPDRQLIGYWQLPPHIDGFGGHPVVVYADTGDAVRVDDRNLAPLTVARSTLDTARGGCRRTRTISCRSKPRPPPRTSHRSCARASPTASRTWARSRRPSRCRPGASGRGW
ncbi:BtrH N-terminal domain-containing protein [Phytohabitans houttuyneae]|uniref:Butirosin biosynthesis protein H N-terminal domain-containing protein n=1 Tax=Phytohabitans houttuyneae TaxID=1076126 RepID=A0A6V8KQ60_9ACTN|nr:BtrH N-terminal domain-containing protein [Phytohabitans houttuyneae]GFJ84521.1 hypothetical protein Phou_087010 [Phytohabitans houttuyneae]